jgi:methylmalonyl-CoA mutase
VIRATTEEKEYAIRARDEFWKTNADSAGLRLQEVQRAAVAGENLFESLMEAAKVCTLGQLSGALYQVGGQYRRNM